MKNKWSCVHIMFLIFCIVFFAFLIVSESAAETLYVITNGDDLNGRASPSKHASVEAHFENGEAVEAVSYQDGWVEVVGGETGTVWCSQDYLSSSQSTSKYRNISGGRVFIRDGVEGRKTGLEVHTNKLVTVKRQMNGWGFIGTGWVNLSYFEEE